MRKKCTRCKEDKDLLDFGICTREKDGHNRYCKECIRIMSTQRRENPEFKKWSKKYHKKYYLKNKKNINKRNKNWKKNNPAKVKSKSLEYYIRTRAHEFKRSFCIDHDHSTNKVRGLLCHYCNVMLGMVHDDVHVLKAAITYLNNNYFE
jgi:hypothetical protein